MPVSTEELELAELKLYPVPTRDELTISFDANGSEEVKLQLVNPLGAVVLEQTEIVQQGPAQLPPATWHFGRGDVHLGDPTRRQKKLEEDLCTALIPFILNVI